MKYIYKGTYFVADFKMWHCCAVVFKYWLIEMCAAVFRQANTWLLEHWQAINSQFHEYTL